MEMWESFHLEWIYQWVDDPISRVSVIFVKHTGRDGYGGPPGPRPRPESEDWFCAPGGAPECRAARYGNGECM